MLLCIIDDSKATELADLESLAASAGLHVRIWCISAEAAAHKRIHNSESVDGITSSSMWSKLNALDCIPEAVVVWTEKLGVVVRVLSWATINHVATIFATEQTLNAPSPAGLLGTLSVLSRAGLVSLFDGFITPGLLGRQYLLSLGVPHERIACAMRPVNVQKWQEVCASHGGEARHLRKSWGNALVILTVAALEEDQNPLITLDAIARIQAQVGDFRIVHAGQGTMEKTYRKHALELGISDKTSVVATFDSHHLATYYGASDIVVQCPRFDTSGTRVLEAMACGRAVVSASSVSPVADLIVHGRTGAIAYQGDVHSLSQGLLLVVKNDPAIVGEAAKEMVKLRDIDAAGRNLVELLTRLKADLPSRMKIYRVARSELLNQYARWWL